VKIRHQRLEAASHQYMGGSIRTASSTVNGQHDCVHVWSKGASFWTSAVNNRFFSEPPVPKKQVLFKATEENALHLTCLACLLGSVGTQEYS